MQKLQELSLQLHLHGQRIAAAVTAAPAACMGEVTTDKKHTCRNSGSFLWILERMVRAPYSRLSLASQQGTTLCASTSWKGMSIFLATCAHQADFAASSPH